MSKSTFANLPAAKRQAIIDIAIEEFAAHPYATASVSHIVARAGIAKGSLYQYFENKQDFYPYLLEYAAQMQLALLRELTPPDAGQGFFALLRWQMSASLRVGVAAPHLMQLMRRAFAGDLPFQAEVERVVGSAGEAHLLQLLQRGIDAGELNPTLDLPLTAFVMQQILGELGGFIVRRLGLSLDAVSADLTLLDRPEVEAWYDSLIRLLECGMRNVERGTRNAEC
ncbi:MAG: TetR/AcrR family transcriptional regulator [Caldilineaceae bacterium]|nr:TetR/AcrR family transcriptional regulator [Caldilineaceae bacterium]